MQLVVIEPHPLLDAGLLRLGFDGGLASSASPDWLLGLLSPTADAPLLTDDRIRAAVRDLLRHAGFRPTGRNKPSSEYLLRAAQEGRLGAINLAVDLGNAVSLHSGLPISVVDADRARPPLSIRAAGEGAHFVFNPALQEIDVGRLLCLHDAGGPCANAVKDAQRTKTDPGTTTALVVVWGTRALEGRTAATVRWLTGLATRAGARCDPISAETPG